VPLAWLLALAPILGLAANVVVQVAACRTTRPFRLLRSVAIGFTASLVSAGALAISLALSLELSTPEIAAQLLLALLTTAMLGYCYFHFLNLGQTARRVRILRELVEAGGGLTRDELLKRYNAQEMIDQRLGRLLRGGQVVLRGGRYVIGKRAVLRMAQAIEFTRFFVGLPRSASLK